MPTVGSYGSPTLPPSTHPFGIQRRSLPQSSLIYPTTPTKGEHVSCSPGRGRSLRALSKGDRGPRQRAGHRGGPASVCSSGKEARRGRAEQGGGNTYLLTYLPTYLLTYLPTYLVPTYLPIYLPAYLPPHPTYLPTRYLVRTNVCGWVGLFFTLKRSFYIVS